MMPIDRHPALPLSQLDLYKDSITVAEIPLYYGYRDRTALFDGGQVLRFSASVLIKGCHVILTEEKDKSALIKVSEAICRAIQEHSGNSACKVDTREFYMEEIPAAVYDYQKGRWFQVNPIDEFALSNDRCEAIFRVTVWTDSKSTSDIRHGICLGIERCS